MAIEQADAFLDRWEKDEKLRGSLDLSAVQSMDEIVEFAAGSGYEFSSDEASACLERRMSEGQELQDEVLDLVAGGEQVLRHRWMSAPVSGDELDSSLAQQCSGRKGDLDLADLVAREGVDLADLGICQEVRGDQHIGAGPGTRLELPKLPLVRARGEECGLARCEDALPVSLELAEVVVDLLADGQRTLVVGGLRGEALEQSTPQLGPGGTVAQGDLEAPCCAQVVVAVIEEVVESPAGVAPRSLEAVAEIQCKEGQRCIACEVYRERVHGEL